MKRWKAAGSEVLVSHRLFEIERRRIVSDENERDVMVLGAPDWINVIPVLPDGRLVFIRQWRYGVDDFTLEIPGGMVEAGEEHREAAGRELLEETGYRATQIERIGLLRPNPAFQTNRVSTWLATGLERVDEQPRGDGNEEIEVVIHAPEDVPELMRSGEITHSLVVAAFHMWSLSSAQETA